MPSLLLTENPELLANIEAEQAVLGALLVNNQAMLHIGQLRAEHFYEGLHARIFKVMKSFFDNGMNFDPVVLRPNFDTDPALENIGGGKYLRQLSIAATAVRNIKSYADLIFDLSRRRSMSVAFDEAKMCLSNIDSLKTEDIAMDVSNKLQRAIADSETAIFQTDFEVTESILQDMKRDVHPYATGYAKLDLAMDGGLYPGKSYGFAARKKMGKTILAGSISQNLNAAGVRHLFICGEMSPAEIQKRTLGRLLRVKSSMFNQAGKKSDAFQKSIAALATASNRAVIYKNAPGLTFEDLKRYVLLARMQKKITGFILDYWQLVGGKPKNKSTAEHLDEVAQWIADTCRKYDLWSIVMAQINQEGNTRGGEGIRLAFDQVYSLCAPNDDPGRRDRWLEMSDTRYTPWRSVGSEKNPGMYLNELGPYFSETVEDDYSLGDEV